MINFYRTGEIYTTVTGSQDFMNQKRQKKKTENDSEGINLIQLQRTKLSAQTPKGWQPGKQKESADDPEKVRALYQANTKTNYQRITGLSKLKLSQIFTQC